MKTVATLEPLTTKLLEITRINSAASVLSWDQETHMPAGGGEARAEQIAVLQGLAHDKLVSPDIERFLTSTVDPGTGQAIDQPGDLWDEPSRSLLREIWRDFSRAKKLPSDFVVRLSRESSLAQQVWAEAREQKSFRQFLPNLRTILSLKREETQYLGYKDSPYDALLDVYEPGSTIAALSPMFAQLKARLVPLLKRVTQSPNQIDDSILRHSYDQARQLEFGRLVLIAMGYDFERGRLDLSAHPFTTSFHPTDVRVTTRVHEHELQSCLFSCIHEGGHGLYDQGLDQRYFGTPLGESVSLGIHESQSRMWENCVGRSRAFWRFFYPVLQQTFHHQLRGIDMEHFYGAINCVKPSLIRVEADELTYNLHIMLRFELEQLLVAGDLKPADVPGVWNEKFSQYFGLTVPNDSQGCLQDIHWSAGLLGYFPTYALGNMYSAQFFEAARRDLGDLDVAFAGGQFRPLKQWLNEKIHRHGKRYPAKRLVELVTGTSLSHGPLVTHLKTKFGELYGL